MKRTLKLFVPLALLLSSCLTFASSCCTTDSSKCCNPCGGGNPYFSYRSQSINAARELVGWQSYINKFQMDHWYAAFKVTPEFTRTFEPCKLTHYLFGENLVNGELTISGTRKGVTAENSVTGAIARESHEWLADYFGLSPNFVSTVKFEPRISNFLVDLSAYVGFGEKWKNGFFRIHAPIVYTKWKLNLCEDVQTGGTLRFDAGYMDTAIVPNADLPENWEAAMKGVTWGDMQEALKYGKIDNCKKHDKTRLSDIELALGHNFIQDEDYHFGLMVRGSIPTGNKPEACWLFEPIVGSGGHFMLGAGLTSHAELWLSEDEEKRVCAYFDANIGHYFQRSQVRSFDLKNKPNSRYMLIMELDTNVENLYAGPTGAEAIAPSHQYNENLYPLINKSTFCTDVSIAMQGDAAFKVAYTNGRWCCDLGYNLWGRSGEKFEQDCCTTCPIPNKTYALKGDMFVVGWDQNNQTPSQGASPVLDKTSGLSATDSKATINAGCNTPSGVAYTWDDRQNNCDYDKRQAWYAQSTGRFMSYQPTYIDTTNTSYQPKFISCEDLDMCETQSAWSHKIFANIGYNWDKDNNSDRRWCPFVGLGGEVEFSGKSENVYSAAYQWGAWIEGGAYFD